MQFFSGIRNMLFKSLETRRIMAQVRDMSARESVNKPIDLTLAKEKGGRVAAIIVLDGKEMAFYLN